jgi:hypothetical protein
MYKIDCGPEWIGSSYFKIEKLIKDEINIGGAIEYNDVKDCLFFNCKSTIPPESRTLLALKHNIHIAEI